MSPDGSSETPSERYHQGDYSICISTISTHVWHIENLLKSNALLVLFEHILKSWCIPSA